MINFLHKSGYLPFFLAVLFVLAVTGHVLTNERFTLDPVVLKKTEEKYGKAARSRLIEWQNLIRHDKSTSDREKLDKVNNFFNRLEFISDAAHWGQKDYWATPIEFLGSDGGDCEDFSLSKYFTLIAMGVSESKLNLSYVKALRLNEHHMVLTYYSRPGAEPLVLDNLSDSVQPASKRTDLIPIYSFNGTGLWLAKQRERGKLLGSSSRLKRWQDVLSRMPKGLMNN